MCNLGALILDKYLQAKFPRLDWSICEDNTELQPSELIPLSFRKED